MSTATIIRACARAGIGEVIAAPDRHLLLRLSPVDHFEGNLQTRFRFADALSHPQWWRSRLIGAPEESRGRRHESLEKGMRAAVRRRGGHAQPTGDIKHRHPILPLPEPRERAIPWRDAALDSFFSGMEELETRPQGTGFFRALACNRRPPQGKAEARPSARAWAHAPGG